MASQLSETQTPVAGSDPTFLIETRLRELAVERSSLLCQLNHLRAATRVIPPEILSEIFVIAATPLRLGAVCSRWREAAWDTPELWTTIRCAPRPMRHEQQTTQITRNCLHLLRLFFANSRQLKVVVELDMDRWDLAEPRVINEILETVMKERADRIRGLKLKLSDAWDARTWKMAHPFLQTTEFLNLEHLHLLGGRVIPFHSEMFQRAPHLRRLTVLDAVGDFSARQPFWNQLTTLRLEKSMVMYCVGLLKLLPPHLETFECVEPLPEPRYIYPIPGATVKIAPACLTSFEWTGGFWNWEAYVWKSLRLPAVRTLTWNHDSPLTEANTDFRRSFFCNLSRLEVLKIQRYYSIWELRDMWECLDSLRELDLDACKLEKEDTDIMDVLTLVHDPERQNLLPNLKVLRINVLVGRGVSRMLRSRRDGPLSLDRTPCMHAVSKKMQSPLQEAVIYMEDIIYEPGEREALKELVDGGLQLDIVVGDERVVWV